jgi:guanylate kinase
LEGVINIIVLIGHSASGKSTIENKLIERGYKKIVSYTTRPPRKGEIDGIDYHFITEADFKAMKISNKLAESVQYRDWHYGIAKEDCLDDRVVIVEPSGMRDLKQIDGLNIVSFFINSPERERLIRMAKRGDEIMEIFRRIISDSGTFKNVEKEVDFVINNQDLDKAVDEIIEKIEKG